MLHNSQKNTKELGAKHDELFCSTEYLSLLNLNITKLPSNWKNTPTKQALL